MKSSSTIWQYVVSVKSIVKILSNFVAFLENMNFKSKAWVQYRYVVDGSWYLLISIVPLVSSQLKEAWQSISELQKLMTCPSTRRFQNVLWQTKIKLKIHWVVHISIISQISELKTNFKQNLTCIIKFVRE